jgi:hypothetical protein
MTCVSVTVSVAWAQLVTVFLIFSNGEFWALTGGLARSCSVAQAPSPLATLGDAAAELSAEKGTTEATAALAVMAIDRLKRREIDVLIIAPTPISVGEHMTYRQQPSVRAGFPDVDKQQVNSWSSLRRTETHCAKVSK